MALNIRVDTNGGTNRFFEKHGKIMVAGEDVGREVVTNELLAELWGATGFKDNGDIKEAGEEVNIRIGDDNGVRFNGGDVQGNMVFFFDDRESAENFAAFLEDVKDAGALGDML